VTGRDEAQRAGATVAACKTRGSERASNTSTARHKWCCLQYKPSSSSERPVAGKRNARAGTSQIKNPTKVQRKIASREQIPGKRNKSNLHGNNERERRQQRLIPEGKGPVNRRRITTLLCPKNFRTNKDIDLLLINKIEIRGNN
jgi:hypothetical protein